MVGKNHILPGGCHHRHFIIVQIRQRYRARQEMLEHIHAEQLNEAKLQFFINISHEIRTPMSLIIKSVAKTNGNGLRYGTPAKLQYNLPQRRTPSAPRQPTYGHPKIDKGQMQLKFQETDIVSFIQDLHYTFAYQPTPNISNWPFIPK